MDSFRHGWLNVSIVNCCPNIEEVKLFAHTKKHSWASFKRKMIARNVHIFPCLYLPLFCRMVISWICSIWVEWRRYLAILDPAKVSLAPGNNSTHTMHDDNRFNISSNRNSLRYASQVHFYTFLPSPTPVNLDHYYNNINATESNSRNIIQLTQLNIILDTSFNGFTSRSNPRLWKSLFSIW